MARLSATGLLMFRSLRDRVSSGQHSVLCVDGSCDCGSDCGNGLGRLNCPPQIQNDHRRLLTLVRHCDLVGDQIVVLWG
jgi:hypothetical protein